MYRVNTAGGKNNAHRIIMVTPVKVVNGSKPIIEMYSPASRNHRTYRSKSRDPYPLHHTRHKSILHLPQDLKPEQAACHGRHRTAKRTDH